ncbi:MULTISPECIES: hypothetical protein [unclassified Brevibacterium]|uniref:hypothetical protein n=1 Tax=unclassified Brevibacterium TaxID=2614124 RepID=UPI001E5582E7|nr:MULTISPECIES: hypothetical protein [unclassified Brevibacterium]MCD1285248.1 hypothetical protein [Brevibacterium sp. CCUG 69071]MDK8434292.1 hypothetical protein [Brevibacterium sp. H-BE7]
MWLDTVESILGHLATILGVLFGAGGIVGILYGLIRRWLRSSKPPVVDVVQGEVVDPFVKSLQDQLADAKTESVKLQELLDRERKAHKATDDRLDQARFRLAEAGLPYLDI